VADQFGVSYEEALEEARLATDLNGGKDPEVAAVLEQIKKQK